MNTENPHMEYQPGSLTSNSTYRKFDYCGSKFVLLQVNMENLLVEYQHSSLTSNSTYHKFDYFSSEFISLQG